jgi:hypothetical protein
MNQNIILVLATGAGIIAGAGGTYVFMPEPEPQVRAPTQDEIVAAIAADPSLLPPPPPPPALVVPSEAEALAAYRKAYSSNPMRTRGAENQLTINLGDCDKSSTGPGVSCVTAIKFTPAAQPINRVIGYSQSASGEWVATNY